MKKELTAVVTGGTRGIGLYISMELAKRNVIVCAVYRSNQKAADEAQALLTNMNPKCGVFQADISLENDASSVINKITAEHGGIDILINNAGIFDFKYIEEMDESYIDNMLSCNFKSQIYMMQAVIPYMKQNRFGRIVNASSISGRFADVGLAAYAASKAAVNMMTVIGAAELAPYGITVNAYAPGIIHTDMTNDMIMQRGNEQLKDIAVHRFGQGKEVASLVAFLASEESGYITGEIIGVDGGMFKVQNAYRAHERAEQENII